MTYTPVIFDWPSDLLWVDQTFYAGDLPIQGGMTLGGAAIENPEPGGRGKLLLRFPPQANTSSNLSASWALTQMQSGAVFRIAIGNPCVQLVTDAVLGINTSVGTTWSAGQTWANGLGWAADPSVRVTKAAAMGATQVTVNIGPFPRALKIGHVIGFFGQGVDTTHMVANIDYSLASFPVVTIKPPLRRALTTTDRLRFRPKILVTNPDAKSAVSAARQGRVIELGLMNMVEALI